VTGKKCQTAVTKLRPGWSLTGALRRVPLLPVRASAGAGGGSVILALDRRPNKAVTPTLTGSLRRAILAHADYSGLTAFL
jgi:hypothetical protein